jgi:hypothetical protein
MRPAARDTAAKGETDARSADRSFLPINRHSVLRYLIAPIPEA